MVNLRRESFQIFILEVIYINKSEELLKLVAENPDLPVVPLVDYEVVGDGYGYWMGSFGRSEVGEYALFDDSYFTDREELEERYADYVADDYPEMSDEDFFAMVKEKTKNWWTKAILVYVETPE